MSKSVARRSAASWAVSLFLLMVVWTAGSPPAVGQLPGGERPPEVRVKYRPGQEGIGSVALEQWSLRMTRGAAVPDPLLPVEGEPLLQPARSLEKIGWHVYRLRPGERPDLAAQRIKELPGVLYAEPVQRVRPLFLDPPNDPGYREYESGENVFPGGGIKDTDTWIKQWNLHYVKALEGWGVWPNRYPTAAERLAAPASAKPIVAFIDSGLDTSHADFANAGNPSTDVLQGGQINLALSRNMIDGGFNSSPNDVRDELGHGTAVTGVAAAAANNGRYPGRSERGFGIVGIGYNAQIAALKVFDASGSGTDTDVILAILQAADSGALILNLSLGTDGGYSQALQDAVNYAWAKGCLIVAAIGNDNSDQVRRYPGACDKVLAVGATSGNRTIWPEQRASYSSFGLPLSVMAPGGDVILDSIQIDLGITSLEYPLPLLMLLWSTAPTHDSALTGIPVNNQEFRYYGYQQGSSLAAPQVAGLAALYAGYRGITLDTPAGNLRIAQAIERGADNIIGIANGGWHIYNGFGRINVANTMKELNARNATAGTISGQVYFNTTVVPRASLTATQVGGSRRFFAGSQDDGTYRLVNLPPGDYDVRASFFGQSQTRRVTVVAGANTPGTTFYLGDFKGDTSAPSKPTLATAPVAGSSPHRAAAQWWARDPETGISHYEYAIGSTPGGTDVVNWTPTHIYETTLTLPEGTPVRAHWLSVRAVNGEGTVGEAAVSQIQ